MIRQRLLLYIGAGTLALACVPKVPPPLLEPAGLDPVPAESAAAWASGTVPARSRAVRFRWRYEDARVRHAGRGTVRLAPPDSLRFDYAGPLGLGAGAAVVLGDSLAWADPRESFRTLVPAVRMLWAALGIVRAPPDAAVWGRTLRGADETRWLWRFAGGGDTLDYVFTAGAGGAGGLAAEWRRGRVIARSHTAWAADRLPSAAWIDFPASRARFELTVVGVDTAAVIPPALWHARR